MASNKTIGSGSSSAAASGKVSVGSRSGGPPQMQGTERLASATRRSDASASPASMGSAQTRQDPKQRKSWCRRLLLLLESDAVWLLIILLVIGAATALAL